MTSLHTLNSIPHVSELPKPMGGDRLHIIESSGTLAQFVMKHSNGAGTYLGLAYTSRRAVDPALDTDWSSGAPDLAGRKDSHD